MCLCVCVWYIGTTVVHGHNVTVVSNKKRKKPPPVDDRIQ